MQFVIDAQLPPALADWLAEARHDAKHVTDLGLAQAEDLVLWRYALENGAVLMTKNDDLVGRMRQSPRSPVLVWLRVGNTSCRSLRLWFAPQLPDIIAWCEQGHRLIEVR